jgi:hypothetical protein
MNMVKDVTGRDLAAAVAVGGSALLFVLFGWVGVIPLVAKRHFKAAAVLGLAWGAAVRALSRLEIEPDA